MENSTNNTSSKESSPDSENKINISGSVPKPGNETEDIFIPGAEVDEKLLRNSRISQNLIIWTKYLYTPFLVVLITYISVIYG